jgi:hypothetical protein
MTPRGDAGARARYAAKMRDDDTPIDALKEAVERLHSCTAKFVEAVDVREEHEGKILWWGTVKVFDLTGHPSARRAYAWSFPATAGKPKFVSVLGLPPIDSAVAAVRANLLAEAKPT